MDINACGRSHGLRKRKALGAVSGAFATCLGEGPIVGRPNPILFTLPRVYFINL
jgi:hypothetical protein